MITYDTGSEEGGGGGLVAFRRTIDDTNERASSEWVLSEGRVVG